MEGAVVTTPRGTPFPRHTFVAELLYAHQGDDSRQMLQAAAGSLVVVQGDRQPQGQD